MGAVRFLIRRLIQAVPLVIGVVCINFAIIQLAPGDAVEVLAGEAGSATPEYMAELRARFGLDKSFWEQLLALLARVVQFDLGYSFRHNLPVAELIASRLPATLLLMGIAIGAAFTIGTMLGIIAARHVNTVTDACISVVALLAYATPVFWIGLMLIVLFSVQLGWLPSGGFMTVTERLSGTDHVIDVLRHLTLPATTLALFFMAVYCRLMRASMLETLKQDYVIAARAKGIRETRVLLRHAARNALLPLLTVAGLHVGSLLGGSVLVETVFSWPGLGRLAFEAVFQRDYNLLLGILLVSSLLVILINILVDLLYMRLDPRIRFA